MDYANPNPYRNSEIRNGTNDCPDAIGRLVEYPQNGNRPGLVTAALLDPVDGLDKKAYDDVTMLMVNTAGNDCVSGSPKMGYGWTSGYVPYKNSRWLDRELSRLGT